MVAIEAQQVFKRVGKAGAKPVKVSDSIRAEAQKEADLLVERYERSLTGAFGPWEPGRLIHTYCNITEMRGDRSVAGFRDQVERRMLIFAWVKRGDVLSATRLPNQQEGAAKPSKFYCESHNPRRSDQARRAYQRDRRFAPEYSEIIAAYWTVQAGKLPSWDIEAHAYVRRIAYERLLFIKKPTMFIDELKAQGIANQAEIARRLGVSRQAVSATLKRQAMSVVDGESST